MACVNVCPTDCIQMQADEHGALHPVIDPQVCIDCMRCEKACPVNHPPMYRLPQHCYAAWVEDADFRRKSASGGVAAALYRWWLAEEGGVAYGAVGTADLGAELMRADRLEALDAFRGSKYVASDAARSYVQVRQDLKAGRKVLFVGLPCQVAGLLGAVGVTGAKAREQGQLLTCDLICHGVSPKIYLQSEVSYLRRKHRLDRVDEVRFRGNDGNNFYFTLWREGKLIYRKPAAVNYYFSAYLNALSLRDNCYTCAYARPERVSDLCLGDFIGLGKQQPFEANPENVSMVSVQTEAGARAWERFTATGTARSCLRVVERDYAEAVTGGASLRAPFEKHPHTDRFRALYRKKGWYAASRRTLWEDVFVRKSFFHLILHKYALRLPRQYGQRWRQSFKKK